MNKRQVLIFWVIAIVLAAALVAIKFGRKDVDERTTRRAPGQTVMESFPAGDVVAIELQGAEGKVNLTKKDGQWVVAERDNYPANAGYVNDFLRTLGEVEVTRAMEAGPSLAPRFGMDEAATTASERGITATFKDATGKELAKVSLGKSIETGGDDSPMGGSQAVGRYVRNHADETAFYAVSEMFPAVTVEVPRWLNDTFLSPEKIQSVGLSKAGSDETEWKVTRETEEAELKLDGATGNETLDTTAAAPLKNLFSYARFDDVIAADKVAELGDVAAKRKAVITTFEGFTYNLTLVPSKKTTTPPPADAAGSTPPPPVAENYYLTVEVAAQLPKERKKEEGEKPEDAKTKDAAFSERSKALTAKLTKEQALAGRTFQVSKSTVEPLLKDRAQLIAKATPPPAADPNSGSVQSLPGGIIAKPPVIPPTDDALKGPTNTAPEEKAAEPAKEPAKDPAKKEPAKPAKRTVEAVTPPIEIPPAKAPEKSDKK